MGREALGPRAEGAVDAALSFTQFGFAVIYYVFITTSLRWVSCELGTTRPSTTKLRECFQRTSEFRLSPPPPHKTIAAIDFLCLTLYFLSPAT